MNLKYDHLVLYLRKATLPAPYNDRIRSYYQVCLLIKIPANEAILNAKLLSKSA
jgi:hypothetical protein